MPPAEMTLLDYKIGGAPHQPYNDCHRHHPWHRATAETCNNCNSTCDRLFIWRSIGFKRPYCMHSSPAAHTTYECNGHPSLAPKLDPIVV